MRDQRHKPCITAKYALWMLLMAAALPLTSCSDECTENRNALPLAGFYSSANPAETLSVDSLDVRGVGVPGDSTLFDGERSVSQLYLPFRIDSDSTAYTFRIRKADASSTPDTVTFIYDRVPHFVSEECGVSYRFDIRSIECRGELIDSVTCPQGYIDNANRQNLNIYFSTTPEQ